ncbi:hypothetical protein NUM3379_15960 [Kineococcus sp. NUM-3379]
MRLARLHRPSSCPHIGGSGGSSAPQRSVERWCRVGVDETVVAEVPVGVFRQAEATRAGHGPVTAAVMDPGGEDVPAPW